MESLLCTVAECAALLHVSVDTIRRSIRAGVIPCKRLRTNIRISRAWLDTFVAETAPMLLTRRQVSVKLGVSPRSVDTLRRKGLLPTVKIEGRAMILVSAVNEYLKRNQFAFLRAKPGARLAPRPAPATLGAARPAHSAEPAERPAVPVHRTVFSNVRGV